MQRARAFEVTTDDGILLRANLYQPGLKSPHLILVAAAAATPQSFYRQFAEYASSYDDFDVVTFDYRGVGRSRHLPVGFDGSCMSDWGQYDLKAMIDWADSRYEQIFVIGHSVAGQIFPKASNHSRVSAAYFVASQSAYHGHWSGFSHFKILLFWYLVLPVSLFILGFMPGWAVGGKHPLPLPAAAEWRRWGTHRQGVVQGSAEVKAQFSRVRIPVHFVGLEDDALFAPTRAIHALMHSYTNARTGFQLIRPKDLGLKQIGHFGFFRSARQEKVWSMPMFFFTQFVKKLEEAESLMEN